MITHKVCKQCNQLLEVQMFTRSKNVKDGFENKCKVCRNAQKKSNNLLTCEVCGKEFASFKKNAKLCSYKCQGEAKKKRIPTPCGYCGKILDKVPSKVNNCEYLYCNQKCRTEHLKELMKGESNPIYNRIKTFCGYCKKEIYEIPFKVNSQQHIYCSRECFKEHRKILRTGPLNPLWREDKSWKEREKQRSLIAYEKWRLSVFERDKYSCQCCGDNRGGNLVSHHKNGWDKHQKQRYDIKNGVTLCESCHIDFHRNFGYGNNTIGQFEKWIDVSKNRNTKKLSDVLVIKESRILAQKNALKLFTEREINGLSVKDITEQTGVPRSTIYSLDRKNKL